MDVIAGKASLEVQEYLLKRRSVKADDLVAPAPSQHQLEEMLIAAARVPDHGKQVPFYFLVIEGEAREKLADDIAVIYTRENTGATDDQIAKQREKVMQSPMMVALVMRARPSKHPLWEQMLTCGAAAQNLLLAANAMGFGVQWLTRWYAYHDDVRARLGLDGRDVVAGFFHIGSVSVECEERERPDLEKIVTYWDDDALIQKGDEYDREKYDLPALGFEIKTL